MDPLGEMSSPRRKETELSWPEYFITGMDSRFPVWALSVGFTFRRSYIESYRQICHHRRSMGSRLLGRWGKGGDLGVGEDTLF